ncbi:uncharacterized protein LOC122504120 [Leptopilina heterotoma]|uniref:uncharacterized protein LOC122504120 n=1 Tax=Leptopilina heterotoma TaxID=63436 RepID=UPI001CA90FAA|nr:uncharacterized protein LOC122504120 [Leptopilina heterotoma]XP_043470975.1 uncharacterized protein LOC122504120 [Leptopilina heterotoma]XP_043470976.1 uncharacterized protein LOC122504120 [Leptopilina heterotoma]
MESIPTDPTLDPPPRACYHCWRKGHNRPNCPKPSTENHCDNCGRKFETVATCPRCAKGYRRYLLSRNQNHQEEIMENKPKQHRREGNPLLPVIWTKEVKLGVNVSGIASGERAWQVRRTPSPTPSDKTSVSSLRLGEDENSAVSHISKATSNMSKESCRKLPVFDIQDPGPPPPYEIEEPDTNKNTD